MKYPTVEELIARGIPEADWDIIVDEDWIIAEVRLHRYEMFAEYDFDSRRLDDALELKTYAAAGKVVDYPGDPRGPHEVEPPDDLTGLIPNPASFIESVRRRRLVAAEDVEDLDAFNEDGRRRAIRIGLPPDSWVIKKEDIDRRPESERLAEIWARQPED